MKKRPPIIVPQLFYLDTSAIRHLVEDPARASLRRQVEQLVAQHRLLLCTSYVAVEEMITSSVMVAQRRAAITFARGVTPGRLHGSFEPIIRQWVVGGATLRKATPQFLDWQTVDAAIKRVVEHPPEDLVIGRDALRARDKKFREGIAGRLIEEGYPGKRARSERHWKNPANLHAEARFLSDQLFRSPDRYVALWRELVRHPDSPVSEAQAWESRKNPWVRLYVRLGLVGVARKLLTSTGDAGLKNDYYDSIHVVCSSVADGLVTDDRKLAQAIEHLRHRDIPMVWSLDSWPAEIERVC